MIEFDKNHILKILKKLEDLINYLEQQGTSNENLASVKAYRDKYGVA